MKIGILTDIHNNVVALEAVLRELETEGCERIVCAGDIIGIGPYPEETVQRVMAIPNLTAVRGNHEKYLLEGMPSQYPNDENMGYEEMEHHKWEHSRLTEASVAFLRELPYRADFGVNHKKISVMHYCMNRQNQYISYTPNPTKKDLTEMFSETDADIVIYGHVHSKMICRSKKRWFLNSGSLGCPAQDKNIARAAVLEITERGHVSARALEVKYDVSEVLRDIKRLNYPDSEAIQHYFFGV